MKKVVVLIFFFAFKNSFADQTLVSSLLRTAMDHHPLLRSQQGQQAASQASLQAARWQFWPVPSVSVESGSSSGVASAGDRTVAYLRLQQPLYTGGRLTANLERAQYQTEVADADLALARQQLALRVLQAWSEVLTAERKVHAYRGSLSVHDRLLGLVKRRHDEGVSALADVALASSRISTLESELQTVLAQRDTALSRLRLITGRTVGPDIASPERTLFIPGRSDQLPELMVNARNTSPGLARLRALAEMASADIQVARSALSPEVFLRLERQQGNTVANAPSAQSRAFIGLSTALGGGLSSFSNIDAAAARRQAALEDIEVQRLDLDEQVQADFTLASTAQARRNGLETALDSANDVLASYERQFLAGRKQWQDVMNAARELAQSQIQLADALGAQQLSNWRLSLLSSGLDALIRDDLRMQPLESTPRAAAAVSSEVRP